MAIEGKHLHLLAGLLVSFLALWISFRHVNFTLLFHLLWKGHYGWLVPILLLMNVSIFFRALFWRTTLSVVKRVSPFHSAGFLYAKDSLPQGSGIPERAKDTYLCISV